jgi:hypothetical protein
MDHMGGHGVLRGIERSVKRGEIGLKVFAIGPVRTRAVVGIHIGGEDPVEQFPPLGVDRQPVQVQQLRNRHDVAVGVGHSSPVVRQ